MISPFVQTLLVVISIAAGGPAGGAESPPVPSGFSLIDTTGFELRRDRPPERIVSLNPDLSENVIALGAGGRLVGVSDFCPLPAGASGVARLGGLQRPGLETILALRPDLVLATREGNSPETVSRLRGLEVPVFAFAAAGDFSEYFNMLGQLGIILGREEEAAGLVDRVGGAIRRVREGASGGSPIPVFIQIGSRPLITASRLTLIGEIVEIAGGENIAAGLQPRYPVISREEVLRADPEVIIIAAMGSEGGEAMASWERFPELRAVKNRRLYPLDPDVICRLGPRLQEALERVADYIAGSRGEGGS